MKLNKTSVILYIATYNATGLKYFGRTIRCSNEADLQKYYHGGGVRWRNHLKKHGDNVTMKIYGIYSLNENDQNYVKPIALKFSEENNIVKSKKWANLKPEDGLPGCTFYSIENGIKTRKSTMLDNGLSVATASSIKAFKTLRQNKEKLLERNNKIREKAIGRIMSEETKHKIALGNKGKTHKGHKWSDEERKRFSDIRKGKTKNIKKVKCPHCNLIGGGGNMTRYHFDNCKERKLNEF